MLNFFNGHILQGLYLIHRGCGRGLNMNCSLIKGFSQIYREPKSWGKGLNTLKLPNWLPPVQINLADIWMLAFGPLGISDAGRPFLSVVSFLGFNFCTLRKLRSYNFFKLIMYDSFYMNLNPMLGFITWICLPPTLLPKWLSQINWALSQIISMRHGCQLETVCIALISLIH